MHQSNDAAEPDLFYQQTCCVILWSKASRLGAFRVHERARGASGLSDAGSLGPLGSAVTT